MLPVSTSLSSVKELSFLEERCGPFMFLLVLCCDLHISWFKHLFWIWGMMILLSSSQGGLDSLVPLGEEETNCCNSISKTTRDMGMRVILYSYQHISKHRRKNTKIRGCAVNVKVLMASVEMVNELRDKLGGGGAGLINERDGGGKWRRVLQKGQT